jgi:hypothetical protein
VTLGRVAFEPVNDPRLRRSERDSLTSYFLNGNEESLHPLEHLFIQLVPSLELALEGKFSDQKVVISCLLPGPVWPRSRGNSNACIIVR